MTAIAGLGSSAYQKCTTDTYGSSCQVIARVGHTWLELSEGKSTAVDAAGFDALAYQIVAAMGYHS